MRSICVAVVVASMAVTQFALAQDKIGDISCTVVSNDKLYVSADIYGKLTVEGAKATSVDFELGSYNRSTRTSKVLKKWAQVPFEVGGMSMTFKNNDVRLEAFFDDVGAMSELQYKGKTLQLQCDISFEE